LLFCGRLMLPAGPAGMIRLQASAAFYRTVRRVFSPIATIEVLPAGVPSRIQPSDLEGNGRCVDASSGTRFVGNELLMFFEPGTSYGVVSQAASSVGGTVIGFQSFPTFNIWQVQIPCSTASCVEAAVASLANDPNALRAEPNFCVDVAGVQPNDPQFAAAGGQYGPQRIEADKAWAITKGTLVTDRTIVPIIAIVDSGIDDTHPDLAGKVQRVMNFTNIAFSDDCDHGTPVAGVAAAIGDNNAAIAGISWYARLLDLKVSRFVTNPLSGRVRCESTAASSASAMRQGVDQGATVVNYSSSNPARSKALALAADYINKSDRLLVSAAGNDGVSTKEYPAGFGLKECFGFFDCHNTTNVSVGATNSNDMRWQNSNFGTWVLFYAPGENIVTAAVGGGTVVTSGTSLAAPHVAGTASLAKAADPTRSMASVYINLEEDRVGNDPSGNIMSRINAFKTVLRVSAKNCGSCPGAASVQKIRHRIVTMGIDGRPRHTTQAVSVHGVAVPLEAATSYAVEFEGDLSSWDACDAMAGFRDCFTVSTSAQPFWMIARDNRDPMLNPNLSVGFEWGGTIRGSASVQGFSFVPRTRVMRGHGASNFLNVVLDTAAGTNPDNLFPSWGTIQIRDITPQ